MGRTSSKKPERRGRNKCFLPGIPIRFPGNRKRSSDFRLNTLTACFRRYSFFATPLQGKTLEDQWLRETLDIEENSKIDKITGKLFLAYTI